MRKDKDQARSDILEAAIRVVTRDGATGFSIEAVAKEAGISKGGLLHHFPTKDALFTGLVEFFSDRAFGLIRAQMDRFGTGEKARMIRAIMSIAFPKAPDNPDGSVTPNEFLRSHRDFLSSLMTTGLLNRDLVRQIRGGHQFLCQTILADPEVGKDELLLWLAMDGFWMWQMIGLLDEDDPLAETIAKELVERAERLGEASPKGEDSL